MESRRGLLLVAFLTTTTGFLLLPSTSSSTSDDELHSLLLFKSLIRSDPTGALSSWSSNSSSNGSAPVFCTWTGVTCSSQLDMDPGRVITLGLQGLRLSGTISPLLGNLTHLRVLDLSNNQLEGEIPPSLGNCFMLRSLNLTNNSLSGAIPSTIGNLSNLVILSMMSNNLSGTIPTSFANLARLSYFFIEENYVHGEIPPWLANLTTLTYLIMDTNMMSGHIPQALSKLNNLKSLALGRNRLHGMVPPALFNMSSLLGLSFESNQLSGSPPQEMGFTLPNLRYFGASYNQLEGRIPASLQNISSLQRIVLTGNRFWGPIPPNIGIHGRLTDFELGKNELQATEPRDWDFLTSLTNCSSLRIVNLQLNNLSGILPNTITNLSQEIEVFLIGGNIIGGHIPTGIERYYKLTVLDFADNIFTGSIPSDIGKLSNLHILYLFENGLHGEIPSSLGNLSQLNRLYLLSNNLEGSIPATIGNLSDLTSIDLSSNLLSGEIPKEILSISTLSEFLILSNNLLDGPISPHVGQLVNLLEIDLSSNKLSGPIPNSLASCLELNVLSLQENLFHGNIPKGLDVLRSLQELDLSNNKLTGPIPEFLESFLFLQYLNLSFNNLSGPVPDKGIFSKASSVSLTSNGMLCSGPPFFHFPACPSPAADMHSRHKQLHVWLFFMVGAGAFIFLGVCIAICYCASKSRGEFRQSPDNSTFPGDMFQRMSYAELYVATDSFSVENLVGRGSFGTVYKGVFSSGADTVTGAVKVLNVQRQGATRSFMSECNALKRIRHRKLVKVITVCDSLDHNGNEFKALVLEYISNGGLDKWLHPSTDCELRTLSLLQRLNIALDVAEALEYLHHHIDPPIVHCDVKPSNILLDNSMVAHIGDFGLAKIVKAEQSGQILGDQSNSVGMRGTVGYLAPEYGMGIEISVEGDVYSYGVLLLEMVTGRRPTDPIFDDTTNLPKYVEMACAGNLLEIMDVNIIRNQESPAMIALFIAPVSRLGLACCKGSPRQRINMSNVVKELSAIKRVIMARQNNASSSMAE